MTMPDLGLVRAPYKPDDPLNLGAAADYAPGKLDQEKFRDWASSLKADGKALTGGEIDRLYGFYKKHGTVSVNEAIDNVHYWRLGKKESPGDRPWEFSKQYGKALKRGETLPDQPATAVSAPGQPSSDVKSAIDTSGLPAGLADKINGALAGGALSSVNLFASGLDIETPVYGIVKDSQRALGPQPRPGEGPMRMTGPEFGSQKAGQWLTNLYKLSPSDLGDLQRRLWEGGWFGKDTDGLSDVQLGAPDQATIEAYSAALTETARYNAAGEPTTGIDEVIGRGSPNQKANEAARKKAGPTFQMTNPVDARQTLKKTEQDVLGREMSDDEAFAQFYRGQEEISRVEQMKSKTYTAPPSLNASAAEYIDTHHLTDKIAYGAASRQQAFYDMLAAPVNYKPPLA